MGYSTLSGCESARLQALWTRNKSELRAIADWMAVNGNADELLSDLAFVMARGQFARLPDDCTDREFLRLARSCLWRARLRCLTRIGRERKRFSRLLRFAKLPLWSKPAGQIAEQKEAAAIVLDHAETLSPTRRDAVLSFYLRGESRGDIANRLGISRANLNLAIRQGVAELRRSIPKSLNPGRKRPTYDQCTARMAKLRESGLSWRTIAKRFGHRHPQSIMRRVEQFRQAAGEASA